MAGLKDYWTLKGGYLGVIADPSYQLDTEWVKGYISRATLLGKSDRWLELSEEQQTALVKRFTLREFWPTDPAGEDRFKFAIECKRRSAEMYVLLSGHCSLNCSENSHEGPHEEVGDNCRDAHAEEQDSTLKKLGGSFGSYEHFDHALEKMVKRRSREDEDAEKDEAAILAEIKEEEEAIEKETAGGTHMETDEDRELKRDERDEKRAKCILVQGKKASFLRISLADYNACLDVGKKPNPMEALREKMNLSERRYHDIRMAMKEVHMDVQFMQFLERHDLIGRIGLNDDGEDTLETPYYKVKDRGHVTEVKYDTNDTVYIMLSGSVRLNLRPTYGEQARPLRLLQPCDGEALSEGLAPEKTVSTKVRAMPLLHLVPGSTVCMDRTLFHMQVPGSGDSVGDDGSVTTAGTGSMGAGPSSSSRGVLRKKRKPPRQAAGVIRKAERRVADYKGPFALNMVFEKRTEFFEIPIRVIKMCLKEEPYGVTSVVYDQLFQATALVKDRLGHMLKWLDVNGLQVSGEGSPAKALEEERLEKERQSYVGAYTTDDFLDARPTDGGLLGAFKTLNHHVSGARGGSGGGGGDVHQQQRRDRTSEKSGISISQSASLPAGAFAMRDMEAKEAGAGDMGRTMR